MCCPVVNNAVDKIVKIATGYAYLAAGINEDLSAQRMKICSNCAYLRGGIACSECGCAVDAKTRLPLESCPKDKWLAVA